MFEKMIKKLDFWDIAFTKMAVMAFVLMVINLSPPFTAWVQSVNPIYFIIVWVVFAVRPLSRFFKK